MTNGESCSHRRDGLAELVVYAPWPEGGHPEYVHTLLLAMKQNSPELQIIWPRRADLAVKFTSSQLAQPVCIPEMKARGQSRWWFLDRMNPLKRHDVAFLKWLVRRDFTQGVLLIEEIHRLTLALVVLVARCKSLKVIVHMHNTRRHDYQGTVVDRLDERVTGYGLRLANAILVNSRDSRDELINRGLSPAHVSVTRHGLHPSVTKVVEPPKVPTVLFFGENRPSKGLDILVAAVKTLNDSGVSLRLVVAGRTAAAHHREVESLLSQVNDLVWLDRFIDDNEVKDLFLGATVVALPYRQFQAQSGVLHLAIAHAVPVVAADLGGMPEVIVPAGCGTVFQNGSIDALAGALRGAVNPQTNLAYREKCLVLQKSLDWANVAKDFIGVVDRQWVAS